MVYHTTVAGMRRLLAEVLGFLCPGGHLCANFIVSYLADLKTGKCREIEALTFASCTTPLVISIYLNHVKPVVLDFASNSNWYIIAFGTLHNL